MSSFGKIILFVVVNGFVSLQFVNRKIYDCFFKIYLFVLKPMVLAEILWPFVIFMFLVWVRTLVEPSTSPECNYFLLNVIIELPLNFILD